ncbi:Dynein light chain [Phytophthora megakarya]|uniref:Dynein light chain n=1 Tax=Phytophthora megakarya TaxID=4795 RepID=A0A225WY22_9STRA|nr:Dynein light chain [Phytophthora megakarya]
MPSAPAYCGWGAKQGSKVRTWKNRYFVLHGRELVYYSGARSDGSGAGTGEKGRLRVANVDYSPDRRNGLLIHGEGKDLKMTTASAQESRVLFRKIKEAIGEQDTSFRDNRPMDKEGWLLQKDLQGHTWERRYVVLSGKTIEFRQDQYASGDAMTLAEVEADKNSPLALKLVTKGARVIHAAAETRDEIEDWDRVLAAAIGQPLVLQQVMQKTGNQEMEPVSDTDLVARKYSTAVCEGWLEKLGQRSKVWKKRYMYLANGMLEYRKGPMEQLSAELYVTDVRCSSEYSNALEIEFGSDKSHTDSDIIYVRAESVRELHKWMNALCDAVSKPRLQPAGSEPSSPSNNGPIEGIHQLPPSPRNVLVSQHSDKSETDSSNTQSSTPTNADRTFEKQLVPSTTSSHTKRGWLYKQEEGSSSWKLRYFFLNGNTLHHCKHVNGTSETLGNVTSVTRNHHLPGSLVIQFEDGSTLDVYGETKVDIEAWYAALYKASWSSAENPAARMSTSNQQEEEFHEEKGFSGWLLKKGQNFKTWKRRYFVLESSRLAYSAAVGNEVLGSGVVFEVDVGDLRPFCLNIRFQNGRLLHVVAPTREAFSKWLDELQKASNLVESSLSQTNNEKIVFDEEFDNDAGENANDVDVEFTDEDYAEYEKTLRGVSLWIAAMQNKPENDSLSSSGSEQGDDKDAIRERNSTEIEPRPSELPSIALRESLGCVGWLKKKGGKVKSWKRRYFTLYGSKLSYYKSEKGSLLRSVQVVDIAPHPSVYLGLIVSTVGGRKLIIQAESQEEFDKWQGAVQGAVTEENVEVLEPPTMNIVVDNRSSEDLKNLVSHSGWLLKEGQRFKTWKRRYFTLKNSALIYYSEIGGVARGHGMVKGAHEDETKPHTLVVEFRSGKSVRVTAGSEAEMSSWHQVLARERPSSSKTTVISDMNDDLDSEEDDDGECAARISRFDSNDYLNDPISNDTFMRLRDEDGKATLLESRNGAITTSRSFRGELNFDDKEEKEDMGISSTGTDYYRQLIAEDVRVQHQRFSEKLAKGEPPVTGCAPCCTVIYKARRTFLGGEYEVRIFEVDDAGVAAVAFQISQDQGPPLKFSRVFSRAELDKAGIARTLEGHVALVDSLELVEDAYFTGNDAVTAGQNMLEAYQLSSTLPGISFPSPIVSHQAALAYFARTPIGLNAMADELQSSEELAFVAEEVDRIILTSIESCLKDEMYDELKVAQWVDYICESIMKGLNELRKPLKYIVSCLIMQKNGAGVHSSVSCHWDTVTDGAHVVKWPGDKHKDHNRSMYCIITVSGLSF